MDDQRGLSGAVDNTSINVTAGLAEIAAGSIPLGPYIAMKATIAVPASVGIPLLAPAILGM